MTKNCGCDKNEYKRLFALNLWMANKSRQDTSGRIKQSTIGNARAQLLYVIFYSMRSKKPEMHCLIRSKTDRHTQSYYCAKLGLQGICFSQLGVGLAIAASYEGGAMFATPGCGMGGYGVTYGCILQLKHTQVVSRCSDCVTIQFNTYPGMGGWAAGIGMGI